MGNSSSSTPIEPTGAGERRSSLFYTRSDDLNHLARIKKAEDARKEAIAANIHDNVKENQQLLKKLFKRMDPTVSRVNTDIQGEVQVSLKYDVHNNRLLVNVIKCRDLGLNNISGKTAQPFVALTLFPDLDDVGMKQTSPSDKPQNPVYNEKFSFPMEEVALHESRLVVKVVDMDVVSSEMEFLGEAVISMCDFDFHEFPVHTAWYTLQPETDLSITGELEIGLEYSLPQTLSVNIVQANNLKKNYQKEMPNPVVKVGIPGIEQVSVTDVKVGSSNPQWNETFQFEVPHEELNMRYVVFTVLDESSDDDTLLGHVVLDLDNLDIENGYQGAFALSDMSNNDRLRNKWFQTTQVQEFKEALWAHSCLQYPNMLFQNHTGRKVIRLTCKSAGGAKATLRLNNGIPVV